MLILKNGVACFMAIVFIPPAFATDTGYPNDAELLSLPQYCQVKLRKKAGDAEYKTWESTLGPDFIHTHHFCAGLNFINRHYRAKSEYDRKYYLQSSLPEFGYMITHASPSYSLMPEVYINRGIALSKLGRGGEAAGDFQKAIDLNPRLPKAYSVMADFYVNMKLQGKALATITEGLRHLPNSKMLQRSYMELGGKQPFPEPYTDVVAAPEAPVVKSSEHPLVQAGEPAEAAAKTVPELKHETATPNAPTTQAIGMPGNPWCRFCPVSAPEPRTESKPVPAETGSGQ